MIERTIVEFETDIDYPKKCHKCIFYINKVDNICGLDRVIAKNLGLNPCSYGHIFRVIKYK